MVYALVVVATTWIVRLERIPSCRGRFLVGLGVFRIGAAVNLATARIAESPELARAG